ncbi:MAG: hypothetical protein Q4C04_06645 [Clostridia bacterium]|nr:hypothetical protein [Clostridia bacterium]
MRLYDLIEPYTTIAIVGMCKNAGKTTVLNAMLDELKLHGVRVALTSVGRDGERVDLVTQTPKPQIFVEAGTLVATAEGLLKKCDCSREICDATNISTPLGRVIVFRALNGGFVEIAGPSMTEDIPQLTSVLLRLGAQKVLVDGAIFRKSSARYGVCEAAALCVGASCSNDLDTIVRDAAHAARLLSLPEVDNQPALEIRGALGDFVAAHKDDDCFYIGGALTDAMLNPLIRSAAARPLTLVIFDGSRALISIETLQMMDRLNISLKVRRRSRLLFVASNPYSAGGTHQNAKELLRRLQDSLEVPVIDVKEGAWN